MTVSPVKKEGMLTLGMELLLTNSDRFIRVITRAWTDEAFKARLFSNTHAALGELGINMPKELNFRLIEETKQNMLTFILPQKPKNVEEMTVEALEDCAKEAVLFLSTINALSNSNASNSSKSRVKNSKL